MERKFGQYRLLKRIGTGGMAEVYLAEREGHELFGRDRAQGRFTRKVAVKLILPHLSRDDSFRELFSREAGLASMLHHPNIVDIQDYGRIEDTDFIVMEYVGGRNLRDLIRGLGPGGRIPLDEAAAVVYRVAKGLACAHAFRQADGSVRGIIHRDLSPHNILISTQGEVKIADFGIARAIRGEATGTTAFKGKLSFMSPEQVEGEPLDHRTDLFSLGTIAYLLFTGRHPFEGESEGATIRAIQRCDYPSMGRWADVPEPVAALTEQLLSRDPDHRPENADRIADALEGCIRPSSEAQLGLRVASTVDEPVEDPVSPTAPTLQRPNRSNLYLGIALTLAAAAVLWILVKPEMSRAPVVPRTTAAETREEPVTQAASPVTVTIRTEPPGALVTVDGADAGTSPATVGIPVGAAPVRIEARLEGYLGREVSLSPRELEPEVSLKLAPLPKGRVLIGAIPWAEVHQGGERIGYTPLSLAGVPVGRKTYILKNPRLGVERSVTVFVEEDREAVVNIDLEAGSR